MPRRRPTDRYAALLRAATAVFIREGYRRTQMSDVSHEMGVAKGTLYLYVASKAALFDAALRAADHRKPIETPSKLPIRSPPRGATLEYAAERLTSEAALPRLRAACSGKRLRNPRGEIREVVEELYETLARNRVALKLVDRSAPDYPELARLFYGVSRGTVPSLLADWIRARAARGAYRKFPDQAVAARILMEAVTFWAVHRHWDPSPQDIDEDSSRETVVAFVQGALLA